MGRISRVLLFIAVFSAGLVSTSSGQQGPSLEWKPGVYKGLRTGTATMQDVVRKLGKPKLKSLPEGPNDPTLREWHYEQHEPEGSCCDLSFKKSILQGITIDLGQVEQSKAVQMFGGKFIKARFSADYARGEGGSSPLCEDPNGDQVLLLDPMHGLSLWVEADGMVSGATFASSRPGIGRCNKSKAQN